MVDRIEALFGMHEAQGCHGVEFPGRECAVIADARCGRWTRPHDHVVPVRTRQFVHQRAASH